MTREEARLLIEKYDEGLTSHAEERALSAFFRAQSHEELPEAWRVYKALFAFVEGEATAAAVGADDATAGNASSHSKRSSRKATVIRLATLVAAACVATAIILTTTLTNPSSGKDYAVIDGRVVTDQALIKAEAEAALLSVAYLDDEAFAALDNL